MSTTSTSEEALRQRNLEYFTTPSRWQFWPFLPLVRRRAGAIELGLLYDALHFSGRLGHSATVFRSNLFLIPRSESAFLALPREVHDTPEEIYAAGWRVD
jgi:hypothetical protein